MLGDGERGLLFEPGDVDTLAAQLARLVADPRLGERLREGADGFRAQLHAARVADELEEVYEHGRSRRRELARCQAPRPRAR